MEHVERDREMQEEALEAFWTAMEQGPGELVFREDLSLAMGGELPPGTLERLESKDLVRREGERFRLTARGYEEARRTIRRHRLSERLFADVLDLSEESDFEDDACRFEHLLIRPGLEERICQLLGHPKTCPHGRSIPAGDCCQRAEAVVDHEVVGMDLLRQGEKGAIAYVHSADRERLRKIMAMGVLPGEEVELVRRYPSFVFRMGFSEYAVDEEMAASIFVRRKGE